MKTQFLILITLLLNVSAIAQPSNFRDSRDKVSVNVLVDPNQTTAGSDVVIAVILEHDEHWHTHTNNPQVPPELGDEEDFIATELYFELPEDSPLTIHEGFIQWPKTVMMEVGFGSEPVEYGVFESLSIIYVPVTIAKDATPGDATFVIRAVFQVCDETQCLRPSPKPDEGSRWEEYGISASIKIVDVSELANTTGMTPRKHPDFDAAVFARIHAGESSSESASVKFDFFDIQFNLNPNGTFGFILLLLVSMFGGFLLNLTPCVLPVIPIKIMGLSASGGSRRKTFILGIWMMLGVMSLWLGLGAGIAWVSSFDAINKLFQFPAFTIGLGLFIGVMAIGMGGLFSIQLPQVVYKVNPKHDSPFGSFLFGIMTAVLSTPCTAPFMGAAAAWAATQDAIITLSVFGAIGFGMAIPYLILAGFPKLVEKMPKAGASSELIKQVMGLLMLAAAVYFVGVGFSGIMQQEGAPPSRLYLWAVVCCVVAAGVWLAWRMPSVTSSIVPRVIFVGIGLVLTIGSIAAGFQLTHEGPIDWVYYTQEAFEEEQEQGNVVVVEFTAEWCLNCKWLETTVLNKPALIDVFEDELITPIKVDLTGNNISGNAFLNEVGGYRIPLLIVYSTKGEEVFRGDFYTIKQVLRAIDTARNQ